MKYFPRRLFAVSLAALMLASIYAVGASASEDIMVQNPYKDVDWETYGQYKTQLHTHTTASDGRETMAEAIENYYRHGYDFVAFTDHGVVDRGWTKPNHIPFYGIPDRSWTEPVYNLFNGLFGSQKIQGLPEVRLREISEGAGRGGRGMLRVPFGIEHNPNGPRVELNSWFCDWGNFTFVPGGNYEYTYGVRGVHRAGGLSMINHPSASSYGSGLSYGEIYEGGDNLYVNKVQVLLEQYPSLLGIEIPEDRDRKLWDILLANLAPSGRNVFGIATSDSHGADTVDARWVWALMEEQTLDNLRRSLETGAFFSVIKADAARAAPIITEIAMRDGTIAIAAENYINIQWVSNGGIITTGGTLDLAANKNRLGAYIRAEVTGEGGTLYTQPFLLSYEGMPAGRPVPPGFVDDGRWITVLRVLMHPFIWILDRIWSLTQYF